MINDAMLKTLSRISHAREDVSKSYERLREIKSVIGKRILKRPYSTLDYKLEQDGHTIPVRIFAPWEGFKADKALLFFHGGGWVTGDIDSYDKICAYMARKTQSTVVSVDYRLAPENPFPAGLEDCYRVAYEFFVKSGLPNVAPENITLIGDSAGANIAAAVSLLARDRREFMPTKQILIYPATASDHSENSPFESVRVNGYDFLLTSKMVTEYMDMYKKDEEDMKSPYFAPILAKDFSNQPETLVITAEYDPLRDEGEAYGKALLDAGNKVRVARIKNALHGYMALPSSFSHIQTTYELILDFLKGADNI